MNGEVKITARIADLEPFKAFLGDLDSIARDATPATRSRIEKAVEGLNSKIKRVGTPMTKTRLGGRS